MGAKTKIEWCDATWSPITGCSHVSAGCEHCYAEAMARRFQKDWKPWTAENAAHNVMLHPEGLEQPLHWKKPRRIFVCSMADLFHEQVPDEFIDRVFGMMALCPQHMFQVLTKRPEVMCDYFTKKGRSFSIEQTGWLYEGYSRPIELSSWPPPNVWLGVTAENQRTADERIPILLETPAAKRFVSIEPMLGPINLRLRNDGVPQNKWGEPLGPCGYYCDEQIGHADHSTKLDLVIAGGESGPKARPMSPAWVRSIRDQCQAAVVPFFFKSWGEWAPKPYLWFDKKRVGKKAAGRELDGRIWEEMPG